MGANTSPRGTFATVGVVGVLCFSACVFELGDVVQATGAGGAGGSVASVGGGGQTGGERTAIDVDTASLAGSHVDFPIPVALDATNVNHTLAGADGTALRFYAEDGSTLLAHEVESWQPNGTSLVWVRMPNVAAGGARIWLHVGEQDAPAALSPSEVWPAYEGVFHLADALPGEVRDATGNGRHGTSVMLSADTTVAAQFADGIFFDGSQDGSPHVDLGDTDAFRVPPGGAMTLDIWYQRTTEEDNTGFVLSMEGCCLGYGLMFLPSPLQIRSLLGVHTCCPDTGNAYVFSQFSVSAVSFEWHHLATVLDRGAQVVTTYLDGQVAQTEPFGAIVDDGTNGQGSLRLGANFSGNDGFDGTLDELRISTRAVPADWIAFQHAVANGAVVVGQPEAIP